MNLANFQINPLFENIMPTGQGAKPKGETGEIFFGTLQSQLQVSRIQPSQDTRGFDIQMLSNFKGKALLDRLKKLFLQNGLDPNTLGADDTALAAFTRLMISAGFDPKQMTALIEELSATSGKKCICVSDLFKRVSELEEKKGSEDMLDPSTVPYIESILSRLLPDVEKLRLAWQGVRTDGEGIDINRLISNLTNIVQNLADKGRTAPDASAQSQIAKLMKDMGMASESGAVTLEKFVARLEAAVSTRGMRSVREKGSDVIDLRQFTENIKTLQNPQKDTRELNATDLTKATVQDGGKKVNPLHGDKASTEGSLSSALKIPSSARAQFFVEESNGEIKPVETIASPAGKTIDSSRPPTADGVRLPVRTLPAYVVNQVSRQIVRSFQNGTEEIRLHLHPPNLGRLQMNIDSKGEMLRVHIVTEHQSTRDLLMSHAGDLKSILTEQGLRLDKIDVQLDPYFNQSLSYARQESNRYNSRRKDEPPGRMARPISSPEEPLNEALNRSEAILDLVA